jgi:hypothetical protein
MAGQYDPEQAGDFRADYAAHFENDGAEDGRQAAVADRAAWAMREADRDMNGTPRSVRPGQADAANASTLSPSDQAQHMFRA